MIYILHARNGGPIKIGSSEAPAGRVSMIHTLFPYSAEMLAVFDGVLREEKFLHECFKPIAIPDTKSPEWFRACPAIWRFILDAMDNGRPDFLPDLTARPRTNRALELATEMFGGPRPAMDYFGYSPMTVVGDTFSMSSGSSSGIWVKLLFERELRSGRIPQYIADLHRPTSSQFMEAAQ